MSFRGRPPRIRVRPAESAIFAGLPECDFRIDPLNATP